MRLTQLMLCAVVAVGCSSHRDPALPDASPGGGGGGGDAAAPPIDATPPPIDAVASCAGQTYVRASRTPATHQNSFGWGLALSADGNTLVVGAYGEGSKATGVNGDQTDDSAPSSGAAYVFVRAGSAWVQQAYLKASNTDAGDSFGWAVAISGDGNTIGVGAPSEASKAGDPSDNTVTNAGAIYVFARTGTTWSQQAFLKSGAVAENAQFGNSVALSPDGTTLAAGSPTAAGGGSVSVFARTGTAWAPQALLQPPTAHGGQYFGAALALASNGNTLAIGEPVEANVLSGAVFVLARTGTTWSTSAQAAYLRAANPDASDIFGSSLAMSAAGDELLIGAAGEPSAATGVNGDQTSTGAEASGAAYVFTGGGTTWTQQAYLKASNTGALDNFGVSVALSGDGTTAAVGAYAERSAATCTGGNQADNSLANSGAVYRFTRGTSWAQDRYLKPAPATMNDYFGQATALSSTGSVLAAGLPGEASSSVAIIE